MDIQITVKGIKEPTILFGFQSMWLTGPVAIQYLIENLDIETIGTVWFDGLSPVYILHEGKEIMPLTILYNRKFNLVIVYSLVPSAGIEWKLADAVMGIAKELSAKKVICLDGIENAKNDSEIYYLTNCEDRKKIEESGAKKLEQGMIFGVPSVLMIRKDCTFICLLAKLHHIGSASPEGPFMHSHGKSAANIIRFLDKYLGINVDVSSLVEKSQEIEDQVKSMSMQMGQTQDKPAYFG